MAQLWQCGRFSLDFQQTKIMGILNCTPDSFSDGGRFFAPDDALAHAMQMIADGAEIIDVGAESTRPGSAAIDVKEEIRRLTPVVTELVADGRCVVSVDTKNAATMRAMLDLGVDLINDVHGLEHPDAVDAVKESRCGICLMHMRGMPENMQEDTRYSDVVAEVDRYLQERVDVCRAAGIADNRLMLDPGFGFGKTPEQNMQLFLQGRNYAAAKYPVLLGVSRKSTIGHYLGGRPVNDRLIGSVTLAAWAAWHDVAVVRVHDVRETRDALLMVEALKKIEKDHK